MKVVPLITLMFTLVLVHGHNEEPCLQASNNNAYNNFVHRHILHQYFDRNSKQEWRRYLQQNRLCHRRLQTFMENGDQFQVEQICQGHGWRFRSNSNLCISDSPIRIYDLTVDNNCQIQNLDLTAKYVVVACDVVDNVCCPVHFEGSTYSGPNPEFGCCQSVMSIFFRRDDL